MKYVGILSFVKGHPLFQPFDLVDQHCAIEKVFSHIVAGKSTKMEFFADLVTQVADLYPVLLNVET